MADQANCLFKNYNKDRPQKAENLGAHRYQLQDYELFLNWSLGSSYW